VSIFDMSFKSMPERIRQTHIVQLIASVQRVYAGVSTNEITNYIRVPLQKVPRHVLEMRIDQCVPSTSTQLAPGSNHEAHLA
jgi:hypothetical protein